MQKENFYKILDRFLSGNASEQDEKIIESFSSYLSNDTEFNAFSSESEKKEVYQRLYSGVNDRIYKQKRRLFIRSAIGVAASIILLVAFSLGIYKYTALNSQPTYLTLVTKNGQKASITLSDGSVVTLNGGSVLKYPEEFGQKREVSLKGEAFFEVAKDKKHPFVISSGNFNTTVLGTSFNVKAYEGETQSVTVATGKVYVQSERATAYILPNQQVTVAANGAIEMNAISASEVYNWKNNVIALDNTPLDELVLKLRREYGVDFILSGEELKGCRFSGKFDNATITDVLESLKYMNGIEYRFIDSNKIELRTAASFEKTKGQNQ